MGGALLHIAFGVASGLIVHLISFRREFSFAIFLGNLAPDAVKFGLSAIVQGTWNFMHIDQDDTYNLLASISDNGNYWIMFGIFLVSLGFFLYDHHILRKKTVREYEELYGFFFLGVLMHLIVDVLVEETGKWV